MVINSGNQTSLSNIKKIYIIASGKGGVGKSTVSYILARQLSHKGYSVGILDADIYGPSIPYIFNVEHEVHPLNGKNFEPVVVSNIKIASMGFLVAQATAIAWRGPMLTKAINQLLFGTDWGDLDYLIIDMPPGTGDIHISLNNICEISKVIFVTTPDKISAIDVERAIDLYKKSAINHFNMLENMSYLQKEYGNFLPFGGGFIEDWAQKYNIPIIAKLPFIPSINSNKDAYLLPEMQINFEL
ncbi:MAG: hypothetical protein EB127_04165 [Alphaproteobacteria bacterium]|nr:hypothetical protein [Alphaproteobacteria bacterium]